MSPRSPAGIGAYQNQQVTPVAFKVAPAQASTAAPVAANASGDQLRDQVRAASTALVDAFSSLHGETQAVYTTSVSRAAPMAAQVSGQVPRLDSTPAASSTVQTTQPVDPAVDESAASTIVEAPVSVLNAPLNSMTQYSSVHAGTVIVNGYAIVVDPATTAIRGLVSALNRIDGHTALLNEDTGALMLSSASPNATLVIADTSGVLAALGIPTGTVNGSLGAPKVTTTQATPRTASNAEAVAATVTTAVDGLNGLLSQLGQSPSVSRQERSDAENSVRGTLRSLEAAGLRGLSVTSDETTLHVSIDRGALENGLAHSARSLSTESRARAIDTPISSAVQVARESLSARPPQVPKFDNAGRTYATMQSASDSHRRADEDARRADDPHDGHPISAKPRYG